MSNPLPPRPKGNTAASRGANKIAWVQPLMPVLTKIGRDFANSQPFAGLKIGMSIHLEAKTAYLAIILAKGGAEVFVTGCNPLSTQDDVVAGLAQYKNITVYAKHGVSESEYRDHLHKVLSHHPDIILDDGGDLMEAYCSLPKSERWRVIGGCEETTTGVRRLQAREWTDGGLPFPMFNVNDAKCKHLFDNRYGTGQSVWDGIMRTTNSVIAGKTVVIAGYGHCGSLLARRADGLGAARIIVTEVDDFKALAATMDGFEVMPMIKAAPLGDFFITATGCKDVITSEHFSRMKDGAFLANAGHFDVEVSVNDLKSMATSVNYYRDNITSYTIPPMPTHRQQAPRTLHLLAEGRLVNLAAGDGHPAEIMDMSFSLQALCMEHLAINRLLDAEPKLYDVPGTIDRRVALEKRLAMNVNIDVLTDEQADYLDSF